jgi:hypothetical protein
LTIVFAVALVAALYVALVSPLNFGPYMFDWPEYPYELSDWTVPVSPVVALNPENHGPPDDPPVIAHGSLYVLFPFSESNPIGPWQ